MCLSRLPLTCLQQGKSYEHEHVPFYICWLQLCMTLFDAASILVLLPLHENLRERSSHAFDDGPTLRLPPSCFAQVTDLHLYRHRSDYDPGSSPTKLLPFWAGMFVEHLGINHNPKAYRKKHLLQLLCTSCWAPNLRNPQLVHALSTDSLLADSSKQWTPCGQRLLKEDKRLLGKNFWSANVPCSAPL